MPEGLHGELILGINYLYSTGKSELTFGLSILDIAGTNFERESGTSSIAEQQMMINTGVSFSQDLPGFDYRLSVDLHPLNSGIDFLRKLHVGSEISLPFFDVFIGYGAGYLSYGAQIDIWLLKLTAGLYGIEVGSSYREQEASRPLSKFLFLILPTTFKFPVYYLHLLLGRSQFKYRHFKE